MQFSDNVQRFRGEFQIVGKNRQGETVYEYEDKNVVVDDARIVTAFLINPFILGGAERKEYDGEGIDNKTAFEWKKINPFNFMINFIKMGGGYPRKRSYASSVEVPLVPYELSTDVRSSLFTYLDYDTNGPTVPSSWLAYTGANTEPYKASSLLYPRKSDTDILDRDYQWSKRILKYSFPNDIDSPDVSFKTTFETTARFDEGNGPHFDCFGDYLEETEREYEYREAGLFIGVQPWLWSATQTGQTDDRESSLTPHPRRVVGDIFGKEVYGGNLDSTLSNNLREYRYWDGHSKLIDYGNVNETVKWPAESSSIVNWQSSLEFRGNFSSIYYNPDTSVVGTTTERQGTIYTGNYMVARKTFPVLTKTRDIEFTIRWSLVFG
jgi:hypothetical protein